MRKYYNSFCYSETGFTIIQLIVTIAILGVLSAVAGVSFGNHIHTSKTAAYATELQDIQTAVSAMLADSTSGKLSQVINPTDDMSKVHTAGPNPLVLTNYLSRLNSDGKVKSGCTYTFTQDGTVTQVSTP